MATFTDFQHCMRASFILKWVSGSEKVQNNADIIYGWSSSTIEKLCGHTSLPHFSLGSRGAKIGTHCLSLMSHYESLSFFNGPHLVGSPSSFIRR